MKNRIKFRAKRIDNGQWIYGDLIHTPSDILKGDHYFIREQFIDNATLVKIDWETLGQFCDCEDREGNDIYDGDNLLPDESNEETSRTVVWNDRTLRWEVWIYGLTYHIGEGDQEVDNDKPELIDEISLSENPMDLVIGNIHEPTLVQ